MPRGIYQHKMGLKRKPTSEETKMKIGLAMKGRPSSRGMLGKHHSVEAIEKMRGHGRKWTDEEKRVRSKMALEGGYGKWLKGTHRSEETKRKISETEKRIGHRPPSPLGRHHSEETKRKMSGENHPNWKGGISFEPYSIDWTKTLKRSIRERDKYTCGICGKEPAVIVHHIDYNKKNCNLDNLITLCCYCHTKTNHHRDYWISYFKSRL